MSRSVRQAGYGTSWQEIVRNRLNAARMLVRAGRAPSSADLDGIRFAVYMHLTAMGQDGRNAGVDADKVVSYVRVGKWHLACDQAGVSRDCVGR